MKKTIVGDTVEFSWVHSAADMSPTIVVYNQDTDTIVDTGTMVSSGADSGHYYYHHTIVSSGYFVGRMTGTSNGKNYIRDERIIGITGGV